MKQTDYWITGQKTGPELAEDVKRWLKDGWRVQGGPFLHQTSNGELWVYQALVKEE